MPPYEVRIEGMDEMLALFSKAPELAGKEMRRGMRVSVDELKRQIQARTPVNTGETRAAISASVEGRLPNIRGVVALPLIHGWPLERGGKWSKMPPVSPLEYWVIRKRLPLGDKTARQVAFAIALTILAGTSEGIMRPDGGARMFEKGIKAAKGSIEKAFSNALDRLKEKMKKR